MAGLLLEQDALIQIGVDGVVKAQGELFWLAIAGLALYLDAQSPAVCTKNDMGPSAQPAGGLVASKIHVDCFAALVVVVGNQIVGVAVGDDNGADPGDDCNGRACHQQPRAAVAVRGLL